MTVPIWRRRNKDGYVGQIMSCCIEICPSAFYICITFCLELIEISSVSLFLCLLESSHSSCSTRYGRKRFENMFPWPGHTGRLNPLENFYKGSYHWFQILPEDPNWDGPWICVHFLETYPRGKRSGHSILFLYHARIFFWVLLDIFYFKRGSVCALHHPSAKRTASERRTHWSSFSSHVCYVFVGVRFLCRYALACRFVCACVCPCVGICHRNPVYVSNSLNPSFVLHRENLVLNNQVSPVLCLRGAISCVGPVALGRDRVCFSDTRFGRSQ